MPGARAPEAARKEQILEAALRVAMRDRLEGFSTRNVAKEAGLSHGLVFFHFLTRERLLVALVDFVVKQVKIEQPPAEVLAIASPVERLFELLRVQLAHWVENRQRTELFFDFWVAGMRHPEIQERVRAAMHEYRQNFQAVAAEILRSAKLPGATAAGLAALAVGILDGGALQFNFDPDNFPLDEFLAATRAVLGTLNLTVAAG